MVKRKANSRKSSRFSNAIQSLRRMKASQRCQAIRLANDKFIRDVVCHVKKLRNKKVSPKNKKLLKRHAKRLRFIVNPKISLQRKRKVLSQKGGFIGPLLGALLPVVTSVAGALIGGKRR